MSGADRTDGLNAAALGDSALGDSATGDAVPIIETRDLTRYFNVGHGGFGRGRTVLKAVDGVSVSIRRGETLALVGETGSGKTTFGRLLLGLYKPTAGDIRYLGSSMLDPGGETARTVRRDIQGVFQDPYSSLNPTMTVGQSLAEVLKVHKIVGRHERDEAAARYLRVSGLAGLLPAGDPAVCAAAVPDFISGSCRWQATDRAPDTSISRGSTSEQTGIANGHRGWKWQPLGRSMAFGMSPARAGLMVLRRVVRRGAARTRAWVYGCSGSAKTVVVGEYSTTRPRYMTAVRWLMCLATSRSWVTNR